MIYHWVDPGMQVRIGVEGGKYMKGMAIHSDNMPDGVDILYYTSKREFFRFGSV